MSADFTVEELEVMEKAIKEVQRKCNFYKVIIAGELILTCGSIIEILKTRAKRKKLTNDLKQKGLA